MKKTIVIGGMVAVTFAALAGGVMAQQANRPARAQAEMTQAAFVDARVARLTAADANNDGTVTAEERQAARQAKRAERSDSRFDRMDANDDGSISRAEFDALREARADRGPRAERAGMRGPRGGRGGERAARMAERGPVVIAEARAKAEQAFARMDTDGNGVVTAAERQAVRGERRARMTERRAARQTAPAPATAPMSE
ncbi:MAG: EF-hand domain-containing protein [Brevundimonas sp.]|uniref:EF-hand domain-containing protein n=1 Tax=Brevundimonas sp. TaxID=1871086 RepID=UPI001A2395ED|nr:EF-hand domain-containing protein [Brevundimonas sp.]MBJ7447458.1 EF-hand domain-containing protein [Brevundimonas sp.]